MGCVCECLRFMGRDMEVREEVGDWEHTWMMEKQSTGAATLLIHILATIATNMFVTSTVLGFVPALLSTNVAIILAMLYLESAAAIAKPPSSSMMTGVHIAEKMYLVAAAESSLW